MKKIFIACAVAGLGYSIDICKSSYEDIIKSEQDTQERFEEYAGKKLTDHDLKVMKECAAKFVNEYTQEDLEMIGSDKQKFHTSKDVQEAARKMAVMGEIINFSSKIQSSCLLDQADKNGDYDKADAYCEAVMAAYTKELYKYWQSKAEIKAEVEQK